MFYVCIDEVSDETLEFLGFHLIFEDAGYMLYLQYEGTEHVVSKTGKKFLMVEDMNDAMHLRASEVIQIPRGV